MARKYSKLNARSRKIGGTLKREGLACSNIFVILGVLAIPVVLFIISETARNAIINVIALILNALVLSNLFIFMIVVILILFIVLLFAIYTFTKL